MPLQSSSQSDPAGNVPRAAVALIRTRAADPEYLFLRRAENPLDPWSGHFALPGGRQDKRDKNLLDTCIRETREECGIILEPSQLVLELPWATAGKPTGNPMQVAPFVFEIPARPEISLAALEIADFHWLPLSYLLDPANHDTACLSLHYPELHFPCVRVGGSTKQAIWGFTYGVLKNFLEGFPAGPAPH
jgi:8-oxo-dGTP pyrophosphatase MutT (NUDIX family)